MSYSVDYVLFSIRGLVRSRHEDNVYAAGYTLPAGNNGMEQIREGTVWSGELPVLSVFDGMGGETAGDVASFIASDTMKRSLERNTGQCADGNDEASCREYLEELCREMNEKVCEYAAENHIRTMGTTAACLLFSDNRIYCANIGDSRIYRNGEDGFSQVSTDHVAHTCFFRKAPLSQYIGIPEQEMLIQPDITGEEPLPYREYLICTDGITDMLNDEEIAKIMRKNCSLREKAEQLRSRVIEEGAIDNATAVLCRVKT